MTENECRDIGSERPLARRPEVALWVFVGVIALAMRLARLNWAPLTAAEAREATLAWRAATRQGLPLSDYSPFLMAANSLLFTLFGATDALARLWPALVGSALALTPVLLRRHLGRLGALGAGLYLALSPTALIASRQVDGTVIAATGAMALIGGLSVFSETKRRRWLWFAAAGLALALVSAPVAYGLILPLGLAWLVNSEPWEDDRRRWAERARQWLRSHGVEFVLASVLAVLVLSTGLGWNPAGVGAVGGLLVAWFGRFRVPQISAAPPLTLLVVYELFGLVLGMGGLVWCWYREHRWAAFLSLWAGVAYLLLWAAPGRAPTDLMGLVLPLALLTGLGVEWLARGDWASGSAIRVAYAAFVLVLWAQVYLMLARYSLYGQSEDLALVAIILVLQVLLAVSFGFVLGPRATLRTGAAATSFVLLSLLVSAGSGVAYGRAADPREPLVSQPTAVNVRDLVATLRDLSWHETGTPLTLDFVYEAPADSVLAWYMRDFGRARRVDRLTALTTDVMGPLLVTMDDASGPPVPPGEDYVGQGFPLHRRWTPAALHCRLWAADCRIGVKWFLFRDGPPLPDPIERAVLWRQVDTGVAGAY